jgi:hypothetical protein
MTLSEIEVYKKSWLAGDEHTLYPQAFGLIKNRVSLLLIFAAVMFVVLHTPSYFGWVLMALWVYSWLTR